ncbi:MAG TPA: hypothetical protein VFM48_08235 [Aquabacterium sp.]|nr:hypothetical protein [Aquabacterium sp.]
MSGNGASGVFKAAPWLLGGVPASIQAQKEQAQDRRRILNAQLDRNAATSQAASNAVLKEAASLAPGARQQALADQADAISSMSTRDLTGAGAGIIDTAGSGGNVSQDFLRAQADRQISEGNRLTAIAREIAKTRAPSQLMTNEAQRRAALSGSLQSMFSTNRNLADAAQQDAADVDLPMYGKVANAVNQIGMSAARAGMGGA